MQCTPTSRRNASDGIVIELYDANTRQPRGRRVFIKSKTPCYLAGASSFEAAPAGPVVVLGIVLGVPLAPPGLVMPEPPPELIPVVAPPCIPAPLVMPSLVVPGALVAELLVGPVAAPA